MRSVPYYNSFVFEEVQADNNFSIAKNLSSEEVDEKDYKRFKDTTDAMKEFGDYVPLPKDEPYFVECTFGEVKFEENEPVEFTHFVLNKDIKIDYEKYGKIEYDKQLHFGRYYYRVSKAPFDYSLVSSNLDDVRDITFDDGTSALVYKNLVEWHDDKYYYQFFYPSEFNLEILAYMANSTRHNISKFVR